MKIKEQECQVSQQKLGKIFEYLAYIRQLQLLKRWRIVYITSWGAAKFWREKVKVNSLSELLYEVRRDFIPFFKGKNGQWHRQSFFYRISIYNGVKMEDFKAPFSLLLRNYGAHSILWIDNTFDLMIDNMCFLQCDTPNFAGSVIFASFVILTWKFKQTLFRP